MSLSLKLLGYTPRGQSGWSCGPYLFSNRLTVLEGPNGAGKTPLLKGLVYCLGFPIALPPDIVTRCASVILELQVGSEQIVIERFLNLDFNVTISRGDAVEQFDNERTFSGKLCGLFGIPERSFATKNNTVTPLYTALLIPIFWIDQDMGWKDLYSPLATHNFVKDQLEELMRLLLNLPGQNRATDKKDYAAALVRAEAAKQRANIKREVVDSLEHTVLQRGPRIGVEELRAQKQFIEEELRQRTSVLEELSTQASSFDETISARRSDRDSARFTHEAAVRRLSELRSYGKTLDTQVAIVATNEAAADAFRTLCGNDACGFFRRPEESYGRRVLYIKDQIKDLETSLGVLDAEVERLRQRLVDTEARLASAVENRRIRTANGAASQLISEIDRLTKDFAGVSAALLQAKQLDEAYNEYKKLLDFSVATEDAASNLKPTRGAGRDVTVISDAASEVGKVFTSWLDTLDTPNKPSSIYFDEHLSLHLSGIKFGEAAPFHGSTRTRIVLAFHAALIEVSLRRGGFHPRFLILDTPKQHELDATALRAFVKRFRELSDTYKADLQLIVAATELEFLDDSAETVIWHPPYGEGKAARFFGHALPTFAVNYPI